MIDHKNLILKFYQLITHHVITMLHIISLDIEWSGSRLSKILHPNIQYRGCKHCQPRTKNRNICICSYLSVSQTPPLRTLDIIKQKYHDLCHKLNKFFDSSVNFRLDTRKSLCNNTNRSSQEF